MSESDRVVGWARCRGHCIFIPEQLCVKGYNFFDRDSLVIKFDQKFRNTYFLELLQCHECSIFGEDGKSARYIFSSRPNLPLRHTRNLLIDTLPGPVCFLFQPFSAASGHLRNLKKCSAPHKIVARS